MRIVALVAYLMFVTPVLAQSSSDICHDWVLKKGWFGEDQIVLEKLDSLKAPEIAQVIRFSSPYTLSEYIYMRKNYGLCGNGMLYFESATWTLKDGELYFDVKGGHFAQDKFHYKIVYTIDSWSGDKLVLKKKKVLLSEVKEF
ncbi:MAG: hypothetical protein AB1458_09145 [Bacteroidota bacterium]